MWFTPNDLIKHKSIIIDDLEGYILPHAGTKYTGPIFSHTLRFKPKNFLIILLFYIIQLINLLMLDINIIMNTMLYGRY